MTARAGTERVALDAARRDATARSRFLAGMGHSLRTPLNGVLGYAEILLEEAFGPLNDRQRGYVERIVVAGQRQLELVDNLVVLARLQAGDYEPLLEPVRVAELARGSVSVLRDRADVAGLTLVLKIESEDATAEADAELLDHAIRNIVNNAVRYSGGPGTVCVSVARRAAPDGAGSDAGWVVVEVADEGPGIPMEEQKLILQDYQSEEALTLRRDRRSGLGLPLARRIIELHGGRIRIDSEGPAGCGSRVSLTLPILQATGRPS